MAKGKHSRKRLAATGATQGGSADTTGGFRLTLRFAAACCRRCGEKRVAADRCPSCGLPPHPGESDSRAQRRRRAADSIRQQLHAVPSPAQDRQELRDTLASLSGLPRRLSRALEGLDDGGTAEERALAATTAVLDTLQAARGQVEHEWPRPWRRYARGAARAVAALTDAVEELVDAYAAPNILRAQEHANRAEQLLDEAGTSASRFYDDLDFAETLLSLEDADLVSACVRAS